MFFKFMAKDYTGNLVQGEIKAAHKYAAIKLLRSKRLFVTEIRQIVHADTPLGEIPIFPGWVGIKELALFSRQFATLHSSGLPITQSIDILIKQTGQRALKSCLKDIAESLQAGNSLGQALAKHKPFFPAFFISMIEAGEMSGSLDQVLHRLAGYFESSHELMAKFKTAIAYPLFVMAMSMFTIGCIFIFVLPTFAQIIIDLQAPVTMPTVIILQLSEWLQKSWYLLILLPLMLGALYKKISHSSRYKVAFDHFILHIPVYGTIIKQIHIVRICRTLAILLESGITLMTGLEMIQSQTQNTAYKEVISQTIESLKAGNGLSLPLKGSPYFPPMVSNMIGVGEETGKLDAALKRITDFYEREVYRSMTRLTTLMEPILICLVGGIVGLIMIAMLMPIFSIMDSIQ
ncbi:type II secretion system F family protein [Desulfotomaculum sp. 1211_IL3151]|uniref:type II secretion system F family protein n=1 Tax=Desulfotomaculum sp. 1211_IL3151 TaxID=3084055 RepID=UPI002FDAD189